MLTLILLAFGLVFLILAGLGLPGPEPPRRFNFGWFGLACWLLAEIVSKGPTLLKGP